jgi:CheY-like chemotaxis protein
MNSLTVLLLGDTHRPEFRDARSCLDRWGDVREYADETQAAAALIKDLLVPDVIVVAQAFPGQFSHQAIDHLRRLAPLARVVGLMGSWCEGEMRTGRPWPAVVRTYWHQWTARCNRELHRLTAGAGGSWALPLTATEEERLLADVCAGCQPLVPQDNTACPSRGLVVIRARSREMAEWLSAACRSQGFATVCERSMATARIEGATAAIFDGGDLGQAEYDDLRRLTAALRPAPTIALLTFPRAEDYARARAAGAAAVLSKPLAVEDLLWELKNVRPDCL